MSELEAFDRFMQSLAPIDMRVDRDATIRVGKNDIRPALEAAWSGGREFQDVIAKDLAETADQEGKAK